MKIKNSQGVVLKEIQLNNLIGADLQGADLSRADLQGANFSDSKGLLSSKDFIEKLGKTSDGVLCYKAFGNTDFPAPSYWKIEEGAILEEIVNSCRTNDCGCGVNVANSLKWCKENHPQASSYYLCEIAFLDLVDTVIPYNSNGKFRASRVKLLKKLN